MHISIYVFVCTGLQAHKHVQQVCRDKRWKLRHNLHVRATKVSEAGASGVKPLSILILAPSNCSLGKGKLQFDVT